ncbi:TolB family protein [Caulobacter segnis]
MHVTFDVDDLLRLRDIGWPDEQQGGEPIFSAVAGRDAGSPFNYAGRTRKPIATALAIMVVDLAGSMPPRVIDEGGELVRLTAGSADWGLIQTGVPRRIVPAWSPDGRAVAYLRRDGGRTRAWVAAVDGGAARAVSEAATGEKGVDIEAVAWTADGQGLVLASRPGLAITAVHRRAMAADGYLYDAHMSPPLGFLPQLPGGLATVYVVQDLLGGAPHAAGAAERAILEPPTRSEPAGDGPAAWTFPIPPADAPPSGASDPSGRWLTSGLALRAAGWRERCQRPGLRPGDRRLGRRPLATECCSSSAKAGVAWRRRSMLGRLARPPRDRSLSLRIIWSAAPLRRRG